MWIGGAQCEPCNAPHVVAPDFGDAGPLPDGRIVRKPVKSRRTKMTWEVSEKPTDRHEANHIKPKVHKAEFITAQPLRFSGNALIRHMDHWSRFQNNIGVTRA